MSSLSRVKPGPALLQPEAEKAEERQEHCRLLALPDVLLSDIVHRVCLLRCDAAIPARLAGSCVALLRALLGVEGVHLKPHVSCADLAR